MTKYILKRIFWALVVLFGVTLITYFAVRMMPADFIDRKFASQLANGSLTYEDLARFKELYGLGDSSFLSVLKGYFKWLGGVIRGNLGTSFATSDPVGKTISTRMWTSFTIAFVAFVLQILIAVPLGVTSATHQYGKRDYAITVVSMMLISLPSFFVAALLVKLFAIELGWFPISGSVGTDTGGGIAEFGSRFYHMIIPIMVITVISVGSLMRLTRTNTLEVLGSDYIRTARAKGLSESTVIYRHAFRNTLIPLVTTLAGLVPGLFGGLIITETFFGIDGIGLTAYNAMRDGDVPFVMGYVLFLSILTVIGIFLADVMYAVVDPRVKLVK